MSSGERHLLLRNLATLIALAAEHQNRLVGILRRFGLEDCVCLQNLLVVNLRIACQLEGHR